MENDCADVPVAMDIKRNETAVRVDKVRVTRLMIVSLASWRFSVRTRPLGSVAGTGACGFWIACVSGSRVVSGPRVAEHINSKSFGVATRRCTCRFHIRGGVHPVMIRAA